jgi:hypothetical protein
MKEKALIGSGIVVAIASFLCLISKNRFYGNQNLFNYHNHLCYWHVILS